MRAWALLLVAPLAFAQHVHDPNVKAPVDDHADMHAIPDGTGPAADGGAWLRIDVTGDYLIHNAQILGYVDNPHHFVAGRVYRVLPHAGPLIWTPPGGKMGPVPIKNLLAPITKP